MYHLTYLLVESESIVSLGQESTRHSTCRDGEHNQGQVKEAERGRVL